MKGVDKITAKIISDAENDARLKLEATAAECEKMRADYAKRAKARREEMLAEAEREAEERVKRAKAAAAVEKRNAILAARCEAVEMAFDAALAEARADEGKYRDLLVKLTENAIENQVNAEARELRDYGDEELTVYDTFELIMNKEDRAVHGQAVVDGVRRASIGRLDQSVTEKLKLSEKTANINGGVIIKYGEMEINCSLSMIFANLRSELESEVYELLFAES
ncbi:MAG: hypothetical protein E7640_02170 [Ruminococcaceae bacterium]|nr:hypothetical protein [Oscillospiraceae bacterium]